MFARGSSAPVPLPPPPSYTAPPPSPPTRRPAGPAPTRPCDAPRGARARTCRPSCPPAVAAQILSIGSGDALAARQPGGPDAVDDAVVDMADAELPGMDAPAGAVDGTLSLSFVCTAFRKPDGRRHLRRRTALRVRVPPLNTSIALPFNSR